MTRQRFIVTLRSTPDRPLCAQFVGVFRSIRSAEAWARACGFDDEGRPIPWSVEPLADRYEGVPFNHQEHDCAVAASSSAVPVPTPETEKKP